MTGSLQNTCVRDLCESRITGRSVTSECDPTDVLVEEYDTDGNLLRRWKLTGVHTVTTRYVRTTEHE